GGEWLADLLRHGLLRASFIPPAPIRAIRELTRYRKTLVQERADETNRLHKTLEGANLKLAGVATDVLGLSGRAMLAALLQGERDPTCWPTSPRVGCAQSYHSCVKHSPPESSRNIWC